MAALLGLLVVLAIITLLGHGFWVLIRELCRAMRGLLGPEVVEPIEAEICPRCGEVWESGNGRCLVCFWPGEVNPNDSLRTKVLIGRLLTRLRHYRETGLLASEDADRLAKGLIDEWKLMSKQPDAGDAGVSSPVPRPVTRAPIRSVEPGPTPIASEPEAVPTARPDVAARVLAYREAKQEALSVARASEAEESEPTRKESFGGLLAAFMEERNIRWGELVGGLLIVGCSLALVVGYWDRIAERPILRFALANGVVAAFFAVGRHAARRWGLTTTARGLLAIAALLVPLSVLLVVSARGPDALGIPLVAGELVALAGFGMLIGRGTKEIRSSSPWATALGVVVPSATIVAAGLWAGPGMGESALLAMGAVPLLATAGATARTVLGMRGRPELDEGEADDLYRALGLTSFAAAVALGMVLQRIGTSVEGIRQLAILAPLAGAPGLAAGLLGWRKVSASLVTHRIAGGSIAVAGALVMLGGVALAWPEPAGIVTVAGLNAAVLLAVALAFAIPGGLVLAGGSIALAVVVAMQVIAGPLPWRGAGSAEVSEALIAPSSGSALVVITLVFEVVAGLVFRAGRRPEARAVGLVALLAGVLGLGIVTWHGLGVAGDPFGATWAFAAMAVAAMAGSALTARVLDDDGAGKEVEGRALAWAGSALMLTALVQGFVFRYSEVWWLPLPWSSALLGHATIAVGLALLVGRQWRGEGNVANLEKVLVRSGWLTSVVASAWLAGNVPTAGTADVAIQLLWLSGVWVVLAWRLASPALFWAFQAALAGAIGFGVGAWVEGRPWFGEASEPWLDPRVFQAVSIALSLLGLVWIGARMGARLLEGRGGEGEHLSIARRLMEPSWPTFDRFSTWGAVVVLTGLCLYGVLPGVAQELGPRAFAMRFVTEAGGSASGGRSVPLASAFELPGIPHEEALGMGSWCLLGVVALVLLAGQWEQFRRLDLLGLMLVVSMVVPLVAGWWESEVAVASALRWGGAIGLLVLSVPIWARERLGVLAERVGWRIGPEQVGGLGPMAVGVAVGLAALPLMAMAAYVGGAAVWVHPVETALAELWGMVGYLFVVLTVLGLVSITVAGMREVEDRPPWWDVLRVAGGLVITMATLALVAVSSLVVGSVLAGDPVVGPEPGSFFGRIGLAGSYAPPILLVAMTLVGYALRERSSGFALAGGLLLSFGATVGALLSGVFPTDPNDPMLWLRLAQLNAIVGASYALAWMIVVEAARRRSLWKGTLTGGVALAVQVALPVVLIGIVLVVAGQRLLVQPLPTTERAGVADLTGWIAFVLTVGAVAMKGKIAGRTFSMDRAAPGALAMAAMLAFGTAASDSGNWLTYHAMMISLAATVGGLLLVAWNRRGLRAEVPGEGSGRGLTRWSTAAVMVVVLFALRTFQGDPVDPIWWTVGGLGVSALLLAALAGWSAGRGFLYGAGALLNLAATLWWIGDSGAWLRESVDGFSITNVVALALPAPIWLMIELRAIRAARGPEVRRGWPPFHRVAAWGSLGWLSLVVLVWVMAEASGLDSGAQWGIAWPATVGVVAIAMAAGFWDERSRSEVAGLYCLGLCTAGWFIAGLDAPQSMLGWISVMVLASYAVMAGALWSARSGFRRLADRLSVPRSAELDDPDAGLRWLIPANIGVSAVVVALAFGTIFTHDDIFVRFSVGKAALATALAVGLLARGERRSVLRATALGFGSAGAVAWAWAWIAPDSGTAMLDRGVAAMVALLATAAGYGVGLVKLAPRATHWARAARRLVPTLLALAGGALLFVIGGELFARVEGRVVAISGPALVAVAAALMGSVVASLVAAIVPGRDPLGLPEHRRTVYVYGAEGMLALLALHLGLTMPWLFSGVFARYWPLIVLGLAFTGVGLGELFRRQGRLVLADPLERSGAVLPMLPLLGAFWLEPAPGEDTLFFLLAGGLYATLALFRSSIGFGAVAALAFNAGLWTILGRREGFGLLEHPQFWIVPPALCVLVGAYLVRDRLSAAQSASVRHVAAGAVYLSSTADLVLNGVAEDPWLPLVLGGLSLLGIFAGIALQVRGFLLLGVAFLGLSIFGMIWYAAVDLRQTWIWAASGIVAGIAILAAFAVFEKRRREVMDVVDRIRGWEP